MESAELEASGGLADESARVVVSADASATPPGRMPSGTIAPPLASAGEDVSDLDALRARAQLQRSTQAWDELAQTIGRMIDLAEIQGTIGEDELIELYAQLGQLEGDVLGRVDAAIAAWRKVTAVDPSDVRALQALERLFVRERRWGDAVDVLEQRALVLDDEDQRRDALLQAAAICEERLDDLTRAAAIYERVRGADPANRLAAERLEAICRQQGRWAELVELLLERSEAVADGAQQVHILHDVASIYEHELGDRDSAFFVLQAAFNRDHAHGETVRELERLATATGRWQELLDEYTGRVDELEREDRGAAAELWLKIGRWYGEHLAQLDHAIHAAQQALRIDPAHPGARAALGELYLQLADRLEYQAQDHAGAIDAYQQALHHGASSQAALAALDRLYRRTAQWEPLLDVLARRAEAAADAQETVRCWLEIGQVCELQLDDARRAIAAYEQVLARDPENLPALRALEPLYEQGARPDRHLEVLEALREATRSDAERVALYERLAAAYQRAGRWDALVETYRDHIATTGDVATRVELSVALGEVYEAHLQNVRRAVEAYRDVLSLQPDEPRALDALGRLHEKSGEWDRAIDAMARLVQLADPRKQVELYTRMGRLQYGQLGDAEGAELSLVRALAIDARHVPAMQTLIAQYSDRGDWLKAAQMIVRAESFTPVAIDKVRLLFEAASIYQHRLRQPEQAKPLYAAVIAIDPEHVDAGRPLAELYFHAQQWAELAPVIDMLCRKVGQLRADPRELNELYYRAAKCAEELGDHKKALQHYKAAYDLDPTYLPTLLGRADLQFTMQDWDGAGKLYQAILVSHRSGLEAAAVVRMYHRLGVVRRTLGERKKALDMFEKALELDPSHRETLEAIVELQTAQNAWEAVLQAKRGLIATAPAQEKVELLEQIGGIYKDRLGNPPKATAAYVEALELAPDDRRLLQRLLDLYTETRQWKMAVETIERIAALESDAFKKGVYFHAAATLCRDELKSFDEAVEHYGRALDSFFAQPAQLDEEQLTRALKSFEAIDKVLTTKRDWQAQERAYRAMLGRLPRDGSPQLHKLHVGLLDGLGEVYRSRLKQYREAAEVFELTQQLDPDDALRAGGTGRAEILAELYVVAGPDHADKAVAQHMRILQREPFKYDAYKSLARIYLDTQQYDKRWCLCSTLAFLKKADADELQFAEQYRPRGLVKARAMMSPASWGKLVHPDENRYISAIFGACSPGVAAMKAFPHKDFGVKREDRRQLAGDGLMFSKLFLYAAQVLNVPPPDVYVLEDDKAADIQLANAIEKNELCPSFMVRPHLLQGKSERELAFLSARRLTFMRPEYYLRLLLPTTTELMVVMLSAMAMLQPGFPVPPNMAPTVQQYLPQMQKRMPPHALEQLGLVVQRFIEAAPTIDLAKWGHAVDAVSHRAGFVVCGDLATAARMIAAEPAAIGGPRVKDKVKELVLFSISEDFFAVRAQLGVTIAG